VTDRTERHEPAGGTDDLDAAAVERVRASFARQGAMVTLGADLAAGDAYAEQEAERVHVATMLATMVRRRAG